MEINIEKRDGSLAPYDAEKINETIEWACEGLYNVSPSLVAMSAQIQFYDGMPSSDIQKLIIKAAANLISEKNPDYQYVAGRLSLQDLRKEVFGTFEPDEFYDHVVQNVAIGKYDKEILTKWSDEEIIFFGEQLVHDRDLSYAYAAMQEWTSKYLVKDRTTDQHYESPQQAIMLIAMCLHQDEPKDKRVQYVLDFYDAVSNNRISLPTPIMAGVRTPTRQFSSCVLIECADSLDSINATSAAIVKYVSQRAGIGVNVGAIRALGSPIRGGEAEHTGCIPFYKHFQTAVKSCSQGGVRGGAATAFYPFWHQEVESLLVLKNNKGTEDNRVRHLDYGIQLNKVAYERMIQKKNISLFSPSVSKELYTSFFAPDDVFRKVYEKLEADPLIPRKTIKAEDLWMLIANERGSTGRIYIQNVDHCNTNSPFDYNVSPCKQSNLCLEVVLPTTPLDNINDPKGEIALCTLAAFNLAHTDTIEQDAKIIVRALDNLLDYQDYPVLAAEKNKLRRTLGVGVVNYALYLAKNGVKYSDGSANNLTHNLFEHIQFSLLKASNELAQEKGKCEWFDQTTYAQGVLPVDRYNRSVDSLVSVGYAQDWEALRQSIKQYGLRNSTLTALMPSETSSKISNATNGIEPVRALVSIKGSKDSYYKQVVPDVINLGSKYETVWSTKINKGYLSLVAIMQKFVDQTISANTNYDPRQYPDGKVPLSEVLGDIFYAYKMGVKTLYYHNTRDGSGEDVDSAEDCVSCKI